LYPDEGYGDLARGGVCTSASHGTQVCRQWKRVDQLQQSTSPTYPQTFPDSIVPSEHQCQVGLKNRQLTAADLTCFSEALRIVTFEDPTLQRNSDTAPGSSTLFPDATAISSIVIWSGDHFFMARYR
jgi:hypothetical protein